MRVAVAIHGRDIHRVLETYELLSRGFYTHATPTLINAGKRNQTLSSCFIVPSDCSSTNSTFDGLRDIANIFTSGGGVGIDLHAVPAKRYVCPDIRCNHCHLHFTASLKGRPASRGRCSLPTRSGRDREDDHPEQVQPPVCSDRYPSHLARRYLRFSRAEEQPRTRGTANTKHAYRSDDIRHLVRIVRPVVFEPVLRNPSQSSMRRVKDDLLWSTFDPSTCPELLECYGTEFNSVYCNLEQSQRAMFTLPARTLWEQLVDAQIETSGFFVMYHDAINRKHASQINHRSSL